MTEARRIAALFYVIHKLHPCQKQPFQTAAPAKMQN